MAILEMATVTQDSSSPVTLSVISNNQTIPLNYLEQIFAKLKKAGIVRSVKGPGGGYLLGVCPEELSIVNIIDAVDENTKMTRCSVDKNCRKNGIKCMTHDLWKGLGNQIRQYLSAVSVKDVMCGNYVIP